MLKKESNTVFFRNNVKRKFFINNELKFFPMVCQQDQSEIVHWFIHLRKACVSKTGSCWINVWASFVLILLMKRHICYCAVSKKRLEFRFQQRHLIVWKVVRPSKHLGILQLDNMQLNVVITLKCKFASFLNNGHSLSLIRIELLGKSTGLCPPAEHECLPRFQSVPDATDGCHFPSQQRYLDKRIDRQILDPNYSHIGLQA